MSHQSELIATDIESYLAQHENKELLRLLTCGSVDDGKSTLIGRLLHDSKMIYEDQLASIRNDSKRLGTTGEEIDLALLVDGLQAEREQGITIDVAYRYFSTAKRKFIIADTPGHEQYTRNMATGASTADLAIILVDARYGVQTQTKRHSFIVSQLGIKHTLLAINKMDLVGFSEERFQEIRREYLEFAGALNLNDIHFVPISALKGDNVVNPSEQMPWYQGPSLMALLESVELATAHQDREPFRFPVQYVNRPNLDFRGYAGTIASGQIHPGDEIKVLPSGKRSRVKSIVTWDGDLDTAIATQAVTLTLEDEIDISRGDMLVSAGDSVQAKRNFNASLVWMSEQPLQVGRTYEVKFAAARTAGVVSNIRHLIDINTLEKSNTNNLNLNEIGEVEISLERPLVVDDYQLHRTTGAFILIDRLSNGTVAAGMVSQPVQEAGGRKIYDSASVSEADRQLRLGQQAAIVQISDAEPALLFTLEKRLFDLGRLAVIENEDKSQQTLRRAGLIVLTAQSSSADWIATAQQGSDLYLDPKLELSHRVDLIIEGLSDHHII